MKTTPRFSIAMPAFNAEATIGAAIESVLAQRVDDWELVVVDDGSTDSTAAVVEGFSATDPRVRLVRQANAGCGAARDAAVRASSGCYVVRFDADDLLLPEYLEAMGAFIDARPGYDIYACNGYHVFEDGSRRLARPGERYEAEQSFTLEDMFSANHIFTIAIFTRDLFDRVGGIDPEVYCEDLDFWFRAFAFAGATARYTPQPLALYTISETQMTAEVPTVCRSRVGIYQRLIDSGELTDAQAALAHDAIERTHRDEWIYVRRDRVRRTVERLLGRRAGDAVSNAMHASAAVLRPAVARLAGLMHKRGGTR